MAAQRTVHGQERLGIVMEQEMHDEIERRANSMYLSTRTYIKLVLADWLDSGREIEPVEG